MYDYHEIFEHPLSFSLPLSLSFFLCPFGCHAAHLQSRQRRQIESRPQEIGKANGKLWRHIFVGPETVIDWRRFILEREVVGRGGVGGIQAPNNRTTTQSDQKSEKITWPKHAAASKFFHFWFSFFLFFFSFRFVSFVRSTSALSFWWHH